MNKKRWTTSEIQTLALYAHEGIRSVAKRLGRTEYSVANVASKYGISLRVRFYCTRCNKWTYTPLDPRTGWCRACGAERTRQSNFERNTEIRLAKFAEEERIRKARKESHALKSENYRLRKKEKR